MSIGSLVFNKLPFNMHMEALDRSFSTGSHQDCGLSLSAYPLTPEPQLNTLQYSNSCLQPDYSAIQYNDNYDQYGSNNSLQEPSSPLSTPNLATPVDTPLHSYGQRTPLSSMSSYSSDTSDQLLLSSSQSSGLSDMPSISNMSISSDVSSSSSSLFSADPSTSYNNNNPFSVNTNSSSKKPRERRVNSSRQSSRGGSNSCSDDDHVTRRSSAPARNSTSSSTITTSPSFPATNPATRKDSFVYDVQLENDNVLLFVPDLDLVKSHLMFAVREEVDVLKERIGELMERINHLEYENTVLRKYATPETLQQLQHHNPNP